MSKSSADVKIPSEVRLVRRADSLLLIGPAAFSGNVWVVWDGEFEPETPPARAGLAVKGPWGPFVSIVLLRLLEPTWVLKELALPEKVPLLPTNVRFAARPPASKSATRISLNWPTFPPILPTAVCA